MIFFAIAAIVSIAGLINFSGSSVFTLLYNIYAFIITYSIWRKFQEKEEQPQQTAITIEQNVA